MRTKNRGFPGDYARRFSFAKVSTKKIYRFRASFPDEKRMLVDRRQSVAYVSTNRGGNRGDKNRESMTMVDPFENIAADDGAAMAIFCGEPVKKTAKQTAADFVEICRENGYTINCRETIVSIVKHFTPGDIAAFRDCDMEAGGFLAMLNARGGSVWGTDGGSIGGAVAIQSGRFCLNVSGVPARVAAAVKSFL